MKGVWLEMVGLSGLIRDSIDLMSVAKGHELECFCRLKYVVSKRPREYATWVSKHSVALKGCGECIHWSGLHLLNT